MLLDWQIVFAVKFSKDCHTSLPDNCQFLGKIVARFLFVIILVWDSVFLWCPPMSNKACIFSAGGRNNEFMHFTKIFEWKWTEQPRSTFELGLEIPFWALISVMLTADHIKSLFFFPVEVDVIVDKKNWYEMTTGKITLLFPNTLEWKCLLL